MSKRRVFDIDFEPGSDTPEPAAPAPEPARRDLRMGVHFAF